MILVIFALNCAGNILLMSLQVICEYFWAQNTIFCLLEKLFKLLVIQNSRTIKVKFVENFFKR